MKIICIGDSLTYGFGMSRSNIWTNIAKDKLSVDIINEGINGDTTGGMLSRFNDSVIIKKPDVVFIMGGTNDLIAGATLGVVQANIMSMVHQSFGKLLMPIIGIPSKVDIKNIRKDWAEFTDFNKISSEMEKYKSWIIGFCKTFGVNYIDFNSEIETKAKLLNESIYMDGLHLNQEGQKIMAEIFIDKINKIKNN
jgi:lysophospholipase L1-like esterase